MSETKVIWNINVDAKVVGKILIEIGKQKQYDFDVEIILQIHSLFDACLSHLCKQMLKEACLGKKKILQLFSFQRGLRNSFLNQPAI